MLSSELSDLHYVTTSDFEFNLNLTISRVPRLVEKKDFEKKPAFQIQDIPVN